MKRRTVLKQLALTLGTVVSLPAWATQWSPQATSSYPNLAISPSQEILLAEIVETIIPTTDTPGAKEIGVHQFILTMLNDCYEKSAQDSFSTGLTSLEALTKTSFGKLFVECTPAQRLDILRKMEGSTDKNAFLPFVKRLTIQGYLNSEYVMTNLLIYELVPARFNGCFPVKH